MVGPNDAPWEHLSYAQGPAVWPPGRHEAGTLGMSAEIDKLLTQDGGLGYDLGLRSKVVGCEAENDGRRARSGPRVDGLPEGRGPPSQATECASGWSR